MDGGKVWLLWRERLANGQATGDAGVLVGIFGDLASARERAAEYRKRERKAGLHITEERVVV